MLGICLFGSLLLLVANIEKLDPLELELILASTNLFIAEIKLFIPINLLILCCGVFWAFLPKQNDDPIIKMVKTTGILGGLLIAMLIMAILR